MNSSDRQQLEQRIGRVHLKQRLGIEGHPQRVFGGGMNFIHLENWYSFQNIARRLLKLTGLYNRGYRNARNFSIQHNTVTLPGLPEAFDRLTLLHLSDLHVGMNPETNRVLLEQVSEHDYDLCVLTGDYRAMTCGEIDDALEGMAALRRKLRSPCYAVLGNHDSIHMVAGLETMGIRVLLNESITLERNGQQLYLAGIDDAHYYRVDNLQKAAESIPHDASVILLSHTPEIYRQAAHAGVDLMLCGHTHGGQICLPGGIPIILEAQCPRALGSGSWSYEGMQGYTSAGVGTSIIPVRFNCPPEITLHHLQSAARRDGS
ncbi:MAG: metallophosphoesterase [Motiliproteus sp.]